MIRTARLEIRPYFASLETIRLNVRWLNDPAVVRFSEQRHRLHTVRTQTEYEESFRPPNKLLGIYLMNEFIGTMAVYVDSPNKVADVGIMIGDKAMWGKGYGFEAWKGACDNLLNNGIRKIEAGCMSINWQMKFICEKYGMREEGSRWGHFLLDNGETADMVFYGKFT